MSKNDELSRNLLKVDHLTDLGLEFFSDTGKFGNDLKNRALESLLLNGEPDTYSVGNDVQDGFDTFHDYVPHDMPSLILPGQNAELIEVFPDTDSVLLGAGSDAIESCEDGAVILNAANSTFESTNALGNNILPSVSGAPPRKKCKIRRIVRRPKLKKKVILEKPEPSELSSMKNARLNGLCEKYNDNTELDNKINDSLLDMLQAKTGVQQMLLTERRRPTTEEKKNEKHVYKFITIFPSKPEGKIINLMVKGKCCRSKQPLTESELRIVTKILNNEFVSAEHSCDSFYRNIYYDAESDCNIRYEVKSEPVSEETFHNGNASSNPSEKKAKSKSHNEGSNKDGYTLNSVARTRCGRISRPPRHVIQDYKRLNESNMDEDNENENNGGYADYCNEDSQATGKIKNVEPAITSTLYGPLEPMKRQFSSLSRCPTCDKIYLGYQRMAIHFQKYPEHKNEELLKHLLIKNKKKAMEQDNGLSNLPGDELLVNPGNISMTSVPTTPTPKRRGRRLRIRGSKSHQLKELLTSFRIEDIVKYAAPMIATVLNSWEYLLLRSQKKKNDQETMATSLLKEIKFVMKQLRSLSRHLLRPCDEDKQNSKNIFTIEEEDSLQYVLGVKPGKYIASEDENWVKEYSENTIKVKPSLKDEYAALCSSTVNSDEDVTDLLECPSSMNEKNDIDNSFYQIITQQVPTTVTVADLVHNIEDDSTAAASVPVSVQPSVLSGEEHFAYSDDSNRIFVGNEKGNVISSINITEPSQLTFKTEDSNLTADYIPQSFSPSQTLNFDSFVNGVDDDLMNAFPISLPMLSDNSSDSKDYKDILNSLNGIECTAGKLTIPHLQDTVSDINMSESSSVDLLSTLKNIDNADKAIMNNLKNTVVNDSNKTGLLSSLKTISEKSVLSDLDGVMSERLSESSPMALLNDLKNMNGSENSNMHEVQHSVSTSLAETSESSCIADFASLDSNFR